MFEAYNRKMFEAYIDGNCNVCSGCHLHEIFAFEIYMSDMTLTLIFRMCQGQIQIRQSNIEKSYDAFLHYSYHIFRDINIWNRLIEK